MLFTRRTETMYRAALTHLSMQISRQAQFLTMDFEQAALRSFGSVFPTMKIQTCHFHFSQSLLRKLGELGLRKDYEDKQEFWLLVKMLMALAYVPVDDVEDSFRAIQKRFPEKARQFLEYFKVNFVHLSNSCRA